MAFKKDLPGTKLRVTRHQTMTYPAPNDDLPGTKLKVTRHQSTRR